MIKEAKPTKKKIKNLKFSLATMEKTINVREAYHKKRVDFFSLSNSILNTFNVFAGVGTLSFIAWHLAVQTDFISGIKISLLVAIVTVILATVTILLLFFGMWFDFSTKKENHRWLASSYGTLILKFSKIYLIDWDKSTAMEYKKFTNLLNHIVENMKILKTAEPTILDFELFLSEHKKYIKGAEGTDIINKVKFWQFWLANVFSMTNGLARFIAKHHDQERQKTRQELQKQLKQQKQQKQKQPEK